MTDTPDDGGPAFPHAVHTEWTENSWHGLSARLYIATQVLAGMQSWFNPNDWFGDKEYLSRTARNALAQADALIAANAAQPQEENKDD